MGTLTSKTFHGIKWSTTATVINLVLQVGYTAVMARLLDPVEFGLVAMANVFLRFGGYFANMGMSQALIQKPELTKEDIRAAFTSSMILGVLFFGILYISAPLTSLFFDNEEVIPIVKVLSINFIASSFATTSSSLIRRELKFQQYSIIQIITFVIQAGIGIALAYMGYGVWSLVYTSILNNILYAILTYLLVRHSLKFLFNWKIYKPLFSFGSRISVISLLEFFSISADTMLIGRYLGAVLLGIYNRANLIVQLPLYQLNTSISRVLFPAFSSIQKDIDKLRRVYLSSSSVIAFLFFSICAGAAVASENIVFVVLGSEWKEAVPILKILAILVPFKLLSHYGGIVCDSTAKLNLKLLIELVYLIVLVFLLYLVRNTNLIYYSFVLLSMEFVKYLIYIVIMQKILKFNFSVIWKTYYPAAISAFIVAGSIYIVNLLTYPHIDSFFIKLIIDIITGGLTLITVLFLNINKPIMEELNSRVFSQVKILDKFFNNMISQPNKE